MPTSLRSLMSVYVLNRYLLRLFKGLKTFQDALIKVYGSMRTHVPNILRAHLKSKLFLSKTLYTSWLFIPWMTQFIVRYVFTELSLSVYDERSYITFKYLKNKKNPKNKKRIARSHVLMAIRLKKYCSFNRHWRQWNVFKEVGSCYQTY